MQFTYTQQDKKTESASLWTRLAAFSLDVLLILTLIGIADFMTFSSNDEAFLLKPERLLHLLLGWLYFAGTETCPCQATLGKYLLHLRVTTTTNERINFKAATLRYFLKPITPVLLLKQYLTASPSTIRRTFHDRLAHTQVVAR
ncbi:RDD family protein [Pontibacter diazotrophicus]|uniref:RDD family protein n=1 Tax=Pontibacter diazotrophicus TaxID=1400979 RepID=A0A3D8LB54_9BACT|nr:RDD family protein [Pontibacter diazotrophicus]RDV14661.1 RDD family protein [Pontibacter diazotrophicus]